MSNGFNQKISISGRIENSPFNGNFFAMQNLESLDKVPSTSFKDTMSDMASSLNKEINTPDEMMNSIMSGNTDIDIHDVMTAMAKAELSVSVATQITTKVIQAYDKIMQISV